MNNPKHTPGPWCLGQSDVGVSDLAVCTEKGNDPDSSTIARLVWKKGFEYNNAKLIAAAPDLLAALIRLVSDGVIKAVADTADFRLALAAISKATGEHVEQSTK